MENLASSDLEESNCGSRKRKNRCKGLPQRDETNTVSRIRRMKANKFPKGDFR